MYYKINIETWKVPELPPPPNLMQRLRRMKSEAVTSVGKINYHFQVQFSMRSMKGMGGGKGVLKRKTFRSR
jgi:hypothetical protein